eukprot:TRINITY_DN6890_c0_g1_i1.p1 TRINITY_DN6890_c0_g1~~TRINITY_DN6890_c0_g1_i1.p1  ORF type:complete len:411 (-),score=93.92 TRINITY_DN6890_c0_g1_i1:40-1248(-)
METALKRSYQEAFPNNTTNILFNTHTKRTRYDEFDIHQLVESLKGWMVESDEGEVGDQSQGEFQFDDDGHCVCRRGISMEDSYLICAICSEYYHPECVNLSRDQAKLLSKYVCHQCRGDSSVRRDKCINCGKASRTGSRYCSHDCGISFATEIIFMQKKEAFEKEKKEKMRSINEGFSSALDMIDSSSERVSSLDMKELREMVEINAKKDEIIEEMKEIIKKQEDIQDIIDSASDSYPKPLELNNQESRKNTDIQDCVTCGRSVPSSTFDNHVNSCLLKKMDGFTYTESTIEKYDEIYGFVYCNERHQSKKEFCKNIKSSCQHSGYIDHSAASNRSLCWCPLSDGTNCTVAKKNCRKHHDWEGVKLSELYSLQLGKEKLINDYEKKAKRLKKRISNRWIKNE